MGPEEQLLTASIRETIGKAYEAKRTFFGLIERSTQESVDEPDAEYDSANEILCYYVEKVFRDIGILAERLNLPGLCKDIRKKRDSFTDLAELVPTDHDIEFHSRPLAAATSFFESMATMTDGSAISGLSVFRTILENTGAIIAARGLDPKNEKDVENAIFEIVKFTFHDAVKQMEIPQLIKSYKPEFGVRSLMAAAEYKFADDLDGVKTALGGFYEDMRGYAGSHKWRTFYAVLYTTAPLLHSKTLEEEFRGVAAEKNWIPVLVSGPGGRVQKAKKA